MADSLSLDAISQGVVEQAKIRWLIPFLPFSVLVSHQAVSEEHESLRYNDQDIVGAQEADSAWGWALVFSVPSQNSHLLY